MSKKNNVLSNLDNEQIDKLREFEREIRDRDEQPITILSLDNSQSKLNEANKLIRDLTMDLKHTTVFISSRQKMHPTGRSLQNELILKAEKYLLEI
jgi:hypothetical protein